MASRDQEGNTTSIANNSVKTNIADSFKRFGETLIPAESDRRVVKSIAHMFYDTIDGVNYYSVNANGRVKQQLPVILNLDLRSDDIITCGYPKSGNHWIFEVLTMILHQNTAFNERVYHLNMLEFLNPQVQNVLNAIESPRSLNSHLRIHRLPLQVVEKRLKIVYIVRNPKDIACSMYYMFNSSGPDYMRFNGSFSDYFDLFMTGECFWGYWFDHIWSYETFINDHPDYPIFILSFEKMKLQPVQVIRDLCAFLGKPDLLAEDIAKVSEFANMKRVLNGGKMKFVKQLVCDPDKEFIFRKGEIGDWKNWLSADESEAFDKLFEERMAGSKLADLVREYI